MIPGVVASSDENEIDPAALARAQARATGADPPLTPLALPDDFLVPEGPDAETKGGVDGVIYMLLHARNCIGHPKWDASARETIRRVRAAMDKINIAAKTVRQAAMVHVLDDVWSPPFDALPLLQNLERRTDLAEVSLRNALAGLTVDRAVLGEAVRLWLSNKREERAQAVHALAKALDCDAANIMQIVRNARSTRNRKRLERRGAKLK